MYITYVTECEGWVREVGGVTFRESSCNGIVTIKDVCSGGLFTVAEPLCKVVGVSGVA